MNRVYYEEIKNKTYSLLIAFTKDCLVKCNFNVNNNENEFFNYLNRNYKSVVKENGNSIYSKQIIKYIAGNLTNFTLPVKLVGTDFKIKVWKELMKVPFGELRTYKDIAIAIGCDKGYRAVGNANNKNPIAIVVPCHRIIGSNGYLTGYAPGVIYKVELLKHEGHTLYSNNGKWFIK